MLNCVCRVTNFSAEEKASGGTFCKAVNRRPGQGISNFCKLCSSRSPQWDESACAGDAHQDVNITVEMRRPKRHSRDAPFVDYRAACGRRLGITACTVVQAVVKATSQSNGKGQILTPWGSETLERISMKLGICNRVAGMSKHANPCGAATTWVVWANT